MIGTIGFLFWSAVVLTPVVLAVSVAALFLRGRFTWLPACAVVAGFLVGGAMGWAAVPAEWTSSIWTTIDAAGNAAKYGHTFEHTAERVLMYFFCAGLLGELAFGVTALGVAWRLGPGSGRRVAP